MINPAVFSENLPVEYEMLRLNSNHSLIVILIDFLNYKFLITLNLKLPYPHQIIILPCNLKWGPKWILINSKNVKNSILSKFHWNRQWIIAKIKGKTIDIRLLPFLIRIKSMPSKTLNWVDSVNQLKLLTPRPWWK